MIALVILAGYLLGWVVGSMYALRLIMGRAVCTGRGGRERIAAFADHCREWHGPNCRKPLGELRDREPTDALLALGCGLLWPVVIATVAVMHSPATPAETRRRVEQQRKRIGDLEFQLLTKGM